MPWIDSGGESGNMIWQEDGGPQFAQRDFGDTSYTEMAAPSWAQNLGFTGGSMNYNQGAAANLWNPTSNNGLGQWMLGEGGGMVNQGMGDTSSQVWQAPTSWRTMDRNPQIDADAQSQYNGTPFTQYGANGENLGTGVWQGLHDEDNMDLYVTLLLAAGAGAIVGGAGAAAGAGGEAGGGAAVAGAGEAGAAGAGGYGTVTTSGGGSMFGNTMGAGASYGGGAAAGGGGTLWGSLGNQAVSKLGSSLVSGGGGGGGSTGGYGVNDLASLFGGGLDYYNQNKASGDMLAWLKQRAAMTDNLYNPGTPEANLLQQEMERKDAAAGRNSQYGPRSVDLAAKMAQIKADANTRMTTGVSNNMAAALNQKAAAPAGLMAALQGSGGMQNYSSLVSNLGSGISDWWTSQGSGNTDWVSGTGNYSQYLNDDYGQFL